jgi:hypothetical protein
MKTVDMIGLMDLHRRKLTCLFPQPEPEIDYFGLLHFSTGISCAYKKDWST